MNLGDFDFTELENLKKSMEQMHTAFPGFVEGCIRELAGRLLAKIIARTPVGVYGTKEVRFTTKDGVEVSFTAKDPRTGGTLRRGWTIGEIARMPDGGFEVEIINPVEYAKYVEYGHRTRNHQGWVNGRFMLTISVAELEREMPAIIEQRFTKWLEQMGW